MSAPTALAPTMAAENKYAPRLTPSKPQAAKGSRKKIVKMVTGEAWNEARTELRNIGYLDENDEVALMFRPEAWEE